MRRVGFHPKIIFYLAALIFCTVSLYWLGYELDLDFRWCDQFFTTATEELSIYAVWKVAHGYPLYEWPTRDWYSLSLYNWLFYYLYGMVWRLSHLDGMKAVQFERTFTMFLSLIGASLTYRIALNLIKNVGLVPYRFLIAAGSFLLWFGPGGMGGYTFTVRADTAAQVLSLGGLALFLRSLRSGPGTLVLASLVFFIAWSVKQSVVFAFAGCSFYLLITMEWRKAALFILCFAIPAALTISLGGEVYRYNVFHAPSINPLSLKIGLPVISRTFWHSISSYGFILYFPFLLAGLGLRLADWKRLGSLTLGQRQILVVALVVLISGTMSVVMMTREGSVENSAFEALIATTILMLVSIHYILQTESPRRNAWLIYASLLFLAAAFYPAKNMLGYKHGTMGLLALVSRDDYREKVQFGDWVQTLSTPVLITDPFYDLPWYSNHGNYPVILRDFLWYTRAESLGLLSGGGVQSLVKKRYFASLLLAPNDELVSAAREAGYFEEPLSYEHRYLQSSTSVGKMGPLILFVRSP